MIKHTLLRKGYKFDSNLYTYELWILIVIYDEGERFIIRYFVYSTTYNNNHCAATITFTLLKV